MNRKLPQNFVPQKLHSIIFFIGMLLLLCSVNTVSGATVVGDWQSAPSTATTPGAWTDYKSWERWDGSNWVPATAADGYPGKVASTAAVTIAATHTIILGDGSATDFFTKPMGSVTIKGILLLNGNTSSAPRLELDTQLVDVIAGFGIIRFNNKADLWIESTANPGTAVLNVTQNSSTGYKGIDGSCSNNQDIHMSTSYVSYCQGGGNPKITFDNLMNSGGSFKAKITTNYPICKGGTLVLTGGYTGSAGTTPTYSWHIVSSSSGTIDTSTNPYSISNATGTYTIELTATTNLDKNTTFSNSQTATFDVNTAALGKPNALPSTVVDCNTVRANWDVVDGTISYELDVATTSNFSTIVASYTNLSAGVFYKDLTGLTPGATYYYRVRANNGTCASTNSDTITFVAPAIPGAPSGLASTLVGCKQVDLKWNVVAGADSYELDVATDTGFANMLPAYNAVNVGNGLSTSVTGLSIGTNYYFRVRAVNSCGRSTNSATLTKTTLDTTVKPTNVAAANVLCSQFDVTWTGDLGALSYIVEVSTDPAFPAIPIGVVKSFSGVSAPSYTVTGLLSNKTYYYRVIAVNGCGNGTPVPATPASVTTIASTPDIPGNVTGSFANCNELTIKWDKANLAVDYTIELATDSNFSKDFQTVGSVTATSYTFMNLAMGKQYYFRVKARNGCGFSSYGMPSLAYIDIGVIPETPTITPSGSTTICETGTLASSTASDNQWYLDGNLQGTSQNLTVNTSGDYTVKVVTSGGCSSGVSAATTVTVQHKPNAIAGGSQTICANVNATVIGASSGNGTIVWTVSQGAGTLLNADNASPTYVPKLADSGKTVTLTMTVTSDNTCASTTPPATATYTVNVLEAPTATAGGSQNICSGGTATVSGATATHGTILWTHNGAGSLTGDTTATPTYTSAPADAGKTITLTMNVTSIDNCSIPYVVTALYTINVAGAPTVSDIEISCNAASFVVNSLVARSDITDYKIDVAKDNTFSAASLIVTDFSLGGASPGTTVVSGLIPGGTYYYRVRTVTACGTSVSSIPAVVSVKRTFYDGTSWTPIAPDASMKAVFTGNTSITSPISACSCEIDSGVNVTVGTSGGGNSGAILNLVNGLDVQGSGKLTFENNASLIQSNTATNINSGNIYYNRISQPMNDRDYTYWCSPVSGQTLGALAPTSPANKLYSWGVTNWVSETPSTVMSLGRGYIIRPPAAGTQAVQFVGIPNNGDYVLTAGINAAGRQNVIGNPYPSAMSADAFLQENSVDNPRLDGTLYFWTHNTPITGGGHYSLADYAPYNFTGGVGTGTPAQNSGVNNTAPTGFIAAGQAFAVFSKGTAAGTVVFKNSMRVSKTGAALDNSDFFRGTKSKTTAIERDRVWLDLTNTEGAFKQVLVGYLTGATNGYDSTYDGVSLNANAYIDFYSINEGKHLAIQGRALPFDVNDQVPLGYSSTIAGTFQISIDHADGSLLNQPIYLEDKTTNVINNLQNGPYTFSTAIGTFNDRFVLRYTDKAAISLGTETFDQKGNGVVVSVKSHKIKINSFDETIGKVMVYDLEGKLLYNNKDLNVNEFTIPNFNSSDQFLIVMIQLADGKWVTKEIIF